MQAELQKGTERRGSIQLPLGPGAQSGEVMSRHERSKVALQNTSPKFLPYDPPKWFQEG